MDRDREIFEEVRNLMSYYNGYYMEKLKNDMLILELIKLKDKIKNNGKDNN